MGSTIRNTLRRILLSSLRGSAVTGIRIKGVTHEFSTIPNITDDVLEIICNVKSLIIKKEYDDEEIITFKSKGKKKVTAKDLVCPNGVEVINKDQYLFEMLDKADIDLELFVTSGYGYVGVQDLKNEEKDEDIEYITLDASYAPIVKVNYDISNIRVGKALDNDLLVLTVVTNGTVNPEDTVKQSVEILRDQLVIFDTINEAPAEEEPDMTQADEKLKSILNMSIDDLELSARSSNCLRRAGITSVNFYKRYVWTISNQKLW